MRPAIPAFALLIAACTSGCATTQAVKPETPQSASVERDPRDPWEAFNRRSQAFNDTLDENLLKPVSKAYNKLPQPVRTGISNVFSNLGEVVVVANDVLQFKFRQATQDTARFVMNSTFGLLGVIDVVGNRGLPKHDEDFGQTLGYWGVAPGPYVVIPFLGPSDVRDGLARLADYRLTVYPQIDNSNVYYGTWAIDIVHTRADLLGASNVLETAALDRYQFLRDAYLQRRRNQVYDGHPPKQKDDDDADEPDRSTTPKFKDDKPAAAPAQPTAGDAARPVPAAPSSATDAEPEDKPSPRYQENDVPAAPNAPAKP